MRPARGADCISFARDGRLADARAARPREAPHRRVGYGAVAVATERIAWVVSRLTRVEDEALLRGRGRYIDDLEPVPNVRHAAILRSQLAHARIVSLDVSAALELPGVVGVLTGEDVRELSRPFPVGAPDAPPSYAAAIDVARYVGEPLAVVVARDRYVAEDALDLIVVEQEPLDPLMDALVAAETEGVVSDRSFLYGDPSAAFAAADLVVEGRYAFPRWAANPVECYGVVCDWNDAEGSLTAWANFQGPFTLHSVAAAALRLPGSRLRLITPQDSGGSFGSKAAVYPYIVLIGLASRKLGVPVRWTEDRLEHLPGGGASTAPATAPPAPVRRLRLRGRAARPSLRRRRGRRRIRPCARAGDALSDARLALRRVPRPSRRRAQSRRRHEPPPDEPHARLRRPAAVLRARADDGARGAAARSRCGGAAATQPDRPRRVSLSHTIWRPLRLRRLPRSPRRCARARPLG